MNGVAALSITQFDLQDVVTPPTPPGDPYLYDTFSGSLGDPLNLHAMNVGPGWDIPIPDLWQIAGQRALGSTTAPLGEDNYSVSDAGSGNASATVTLNPVTQDAGFIFRFVDFENFWLVWIDVGNLSGLQLYKYEGGFVTLIDNDPSFVPAVNTEYQLVATVNADNATITIDGANSVGFANDIFSQTATKWGMYVFSGNAFFDDFRVAAL